MTGQDLEAIRRLSHDYSWAVDNGDLAALRELWVEDAVWDVSSFGMANVLGRDAIGDFFGELWKNTTHRIHLASNHRIDIDGDSASGTVYLHAFVANPDGSRDESHGYYEDKYVRTETGWKFKQRKPMALMPPPPAPVN